MAQSAESTTQRIRFEKNMRSIGNGRYEIESAGGPPAMHAANERVRGMIAVVYAEGYGHDVALDSPPNASEPATTSCSASLGPGVRWDSEFQWIIDPTNGDGISRQFMVDSVWQSTNEYERRLMRPVVTGQDTINCADGVDMDSPDGKNEIMFTFIEEPGVLAMMMAWVDSNNRIINADIALNLHFPWGNGSLDPNAYDLPSVLAHEMGHAMGMAHIPVNAATMAPTAAKGEIIKRDLLPCEAAGLCVMYGEPAHMCLEYGEPALPAFVDVGTNSRCAVVPPATTTSPSASPASRTTTGILLVSIATASFI